MKTPWTSVLMSIPYPFSRPLFSIPHLFVYSCSFCSVLSPSSFWTLVIYFSSQYHIWAIISLIISWTCLPWVIKLDSFNPYLHTAPWHSLNDTRNCICTAICSLYSIYNAGLNLPRFYWSRETGWYQYRHDKLCRLSHSYPCDIY